MAAVLLPSLNFTYEFAGVYKFQAQLISGTRSSASAVGTIRIDRRDHGFGMDVCLNSMHARARARVCVCGFKSRIVKLTLCEMDFMRIFWITVDIFWKPFEEMKSFGGIERFILWRILIRLEIRLFIFNLNILNVFLLNDNDILN